jgi:hypothetical protein
MVLQEVVGGVDLLVTVVSGLNQHDCECDHALIVHLPHLCTIRYGHFVPEMAAGIAYALSYSEDVSVTGTDALFQGILEGVSDTRKAMKGPEFVMCDTDEW